jgi:hypothetical protein
VACYLARKSDCSVCPLKSECTTGVQRKLARDVNEKARDHVRRLMKTDDYQVSFKQRKLVETGFGDLKRNLGFTRLKLRGLNGAHDEFLLAATVQNLKRLARSLWPPPGTPKASGAA